MNASTLQTMKEAKRWLLRKGKVPFYAASLSPRSATDTAEDCAKLVTHAEAIQQLKQHQQNGKASGFELGFALGPDESGNFWQGIDLDDLLAKKLMSLMLAVHGYVEYSPSGDGAHAIGYGKRIVNRTNHAAGIEVYSYGRFFTFTENVIRDAPLTDLSEFVALHIPAHDTSETHSSTRELNSGSVVVGPEVYDELERALNVVPAESYENWYLVLQAMKRLADSDRAYAIAKNWSMSSSVPEHTKEVFNRKWQKDLESPGPLSYKSIFMLANEHDPNWNQHPTKPSSIQWQEIPLTNLQLEPVDYLIDGFLARSLMVFVGKPGMGKSTAMVALCAAVAGLELPNCSLRPPVKGRKVIYITEDTDQFKRNIIALHRNFDIALEDIDASIKLLAAQRVRGEQLLSLKDMVSRHTTYTDDGVMLRPWLIFDTTSASFHLEDENSNAEVATVLALLKAEFYEKMGCSVCMVAHSGKNASREDLVTDPRGAGAWAGDTTLTSGMVEDKDGQKYIVLGKRRYFAKYTEARVGLVSTPVTIMDNYGNAQDLQLESALLEWSNPSGREKAQTSSFQKQQKQLDAAVLNFLYSESLRGNKFTSNGLISVRYEIEGRPGKDRIKQSTSRLTKQGLLAKSEGKPGHSDGWSFTLTEDGIKEATQNQS
jgi:hypothetical protein